MGLKSNSQQLYTNSWEMCQICMDFEIFSLNQACLLISLALSSALICKKCTYDKMFQNAKFDNYTAKYNFQLAER